MIREEAIYWEVDKLINYKPLFKLFLRALLKYDKHRDKTLGLFTKNLPVDTVMYDVGAHIGMYSITAARDLPKSKVYAFEPNPRTYLSLLKNIQAFNLQDRIEPYNIGLSDKNNREQFYISSAPARSSLYPKWAGIFNYKIEREITIKCERLDDAIKNYELPAPTLIKIDTEGNEVPILRGAMRTLIRSYPTLIIESHGNKEEIIKTLTDIGYIYDQTRNNYTMWFTKK
jgi:FkbM family methyltransferase